MATSSGNTTISISTSGSEGNHQAIDERKRKRMTSNRESARRSRVRKQQHLDDLTAKINSLKKENSQIIQTVNITSQQFMNVESENSVLRAQMNELSQRLDSLNGMINDMNALGGVVDVDNGGGYFGNNDDFEFMNGFFGGNFSDHHVINNDPWNLNYLNKPIIASNDSIQYEF